MIEGISKSEEFLHDASKRLRKTQYFCDHELEHQFKFEKEFWKNFILRMNNFSDTRESLRDIIFSSQIIK